MSFNTGTKVFPSANCIYVDNDFLALRAKGLLAYGTLGDAIIAWRGTGEAVRKFGLPTATNRGTIILGAGTINSGQSDAGGSCYLEVDFMNIVGQGRDVTTLVNNLSATDGILIIYSSPTANISDFTIKTSASALQCLKFTNSNWSGTMSRIRLTGNPTANFFLFNSFFLAAGLIEDCIFDFSGQTTSFVPFSLSNGNNAGTIRNCSFRTSSSSINGFKFQGNDNFIVKGCSFIGGPSSEMIRCDSTAMSNPKFEDCTIENFSTVGIFIAGGNSSPEITIQDCNIYCDTDVCLSLVSYEKTRILGCQIETVGTNKDAILLNAGSTGLTVFGCRIIGAGNGRAINSSLTIPIEVSHCTMRKQRRSQAIPGESVGANLQNTIWVPYNSEIEASVGPTTPFPVGGLVSWWKLNEPKASAIRRDCFGNNHVAPFNNPSFATDGNVEPIVAKFDRSIVQFLVRYDRNSPSLAVGDFDFTVCCWVKMALDGVNSPSFVGKFGEGDSFYDFSLYHFGPTNQVIFDVGKSDGTRLAEADGPNLPNNAWAFIVGWHDSVADTVNVQVNNGSIFSSPTAGGSPSTLNCPLFIGGDPISVGSPSHAMNGEMSDVAFYKKVLTTADKSYLYNGGNQGTIPL